MGMRMTWVATALAIVNVLCRSMGALFLWVMALGTLLGTKWFRTRALVLALALIPPLYAVSRVSGIASGETMIDVAPSLLA